MVVDIDEEDRQVILLALAELALSRPGWNDGCLRPIAEKLSGAGLFDQLKGLNADRVKAERGLA